MAVLKFQDLRFIEEKDLIRVYFLKIYKFTISKKDLMAIADFKIHSNAIEFSCSEKKANNKFNKVLEKGFQNMICSINKQKTVYVHRNSGIPLVGSGVFGLIDRNTSCIEVKPLTACNLDCMYCSVNAGITSKKQADYVVEKDYLIEEFNELVEKKQHEVEVHIGPQGEPLLYAPLVELVKDIKSNPKVKFISMDTNGVWLTKKLVDDLVKAGLTRFNISLNALDQEKCNYMAGMHFNLKHVLEMIDYAGKKTSVLLAPVIIPGINDDEVVALAKKAKTIKSKYPTIGIQNFLNYKRGRNPVKQRSWEDFFKMLEPIEKKENIKLCLSSDDFKTVQDTKLEKPFNKKQIIKARVVCDGPLNGEKIASCKNRAIIVEKSGGVGINSEIKIKIIRDKHNIFRGVKQ